MRTYQWLKTECEHCDGDRQRTKRMPFGVVLVWGRLDYLRGYVCPECDDSIDEMESEERLAEETYQ